MGSSAAARASENNAAHEGLASSISALNAYSQDIDTIARHTRDIGRMVEEFVTYARMPTSVYAQENLVSIIRKAVFSSQTAHPQVTFRQDLPQTPVPILCDEGQLGQALLNLLKNAAEAIDIDALYAQCVEWGRALEPYIDHTGRRGQPAQTQQQRVQQCHATSAGSSRIVPALVPIRAVTRGQPSGCFEGTPARRG